MDHQTGISEVIILTPTCNERGHADDSVTNVTHPFLFCCTASTHTETIIVGYPRAVLLKCESRHNACLGLLKRIVYAIGNLDTRQNACLGLLNRIVCAFGNLDTCQHRLPGAPKAKQVRVWKPRRSPKSLPGAPKANRGRV